MMNILDKKLVSYKQLPIKECREIVFSNGGHLFACQSGFDIHVYKFYTGILTNNFKFMAHTAPVKRISWFEDDTGFVSCGQDATIYVWKLYPQKADNQYVGEKTAVLPTAPIWDFRVPGKIQFFSVASYKQEGSLEPLIYATGQDRSIREISRKEQKSVEELRYEENLTYSQILIGYQRSLIYAGLAEQNRPGSIQIFRYTDSTIEKACEVQAHSLQIERMRLNYDNSKLFSVGYDGTLACFQVIDKDPIAKARLQ